MVKLDKFDNPEFIGTIKSVEIKELMHIIDEQYHEKFSNLDRDHLLVVYDFDGQEREWFAMLPSLQGYSRSNLQRFRAVNSKLPVDTDDWVGCEIKLKLDAKGYPTVAL